MKVKKILNISYDITEGSEFYMADTDTFLLEKLNDKFKNKCYTNLYILSVDKIITRSNLRCIDNKNDGTIKVDIKCEVTGEYYITGEILFGCTIKSISINGIIAEHPNAVISLKKDFGINAKNQINAAYQFIGVKKVDVNIPIIVTQCKYSLYKSKVTISGIPFIKPFETGVIFTSNFKFISEDETQLLNSLFEKIKSLETKHNEIIEQIKTNQKLNKIYKTSVFLIKYKIDNHIIEPKYKKIYTKINIDELEDYYKKSNGSNIADMSVLSLINLIDTSPFIYFDANDNFYTFPSNDQEIQKNLFITNISQSTIKIADHYLNTIISNMENILNLYNYYSNFPESENIMDSMYFKHIYNASKKSLNEE